MPFYRKGDLVKNFLFLLIVMTGLPALTAEVSVAMDDFKVHEEAARTMRKSP